MTRERLKYLLSDYHLLNISREAEESAGMAYFRAFNRDAREDTLLRVWRDRLTELLLRPEADDDCYNCDHLRSEHHDDGRCTYQLSAGSRCSCDRFRLLEDS